MAELATYFIAFLLTWNAVGVVRGRSRSVRVTLALWRGLRWRHATTAGVVAGVTCLLVAALLTWLPYGQVGWWSLLGGEGTALLGQGAATRAPDANPLLRVIPFLAPLLLLVILPTAARFEERYFRRGLQDLGAGAQARRQLIFGLLHMLVGVPLAAGLALAGTGALYLAIYLRTWRRTGSQGIATLEATRAHLATNTLILLLVAAGLLLGAKAGVAA